MQKIIMYLVILINTGDFQVLIFQFILNSDGYA